MTEDRDGEKEDEPGEAELDVNVELHKLDVAMDRELDGTRSRMLDVTEDGEQEDNPELNVAAELSKLDVAIDRDLDKGARELNVTKTGSCT